MNRLRQLIHRIRQSHQRRSAARLAAWLRSSNAEPVNGFRTAEIRRRLRR